MIRRTLSEAFSWAVRWSGLAFLVRETIATRHAAILLYHDPSPTVLEAHLRYLSSRYRFIALSDLVDALHARDWSKIPEKALVVTLDDGVKGNFALLDLFVAYSVVPTIYVCTEIVGTNRHFWFLETDDATGLKSLPNSERLARLLETVAYTPDREYPERQALTCAEIRAMASHVDFQSHTRFHPILTTCGDDECEVEIARSRVEVENLSGSACIHFSFPNGDYAERELELVKRAGYASARTIDFGWNSVRTDPYRLKILGCSSDDESVNRLAADLTGITGFLGRLVRGSGRGRHRSLQLPGA
jgi:peptidoglycan/xylan/chitin deacetylase (PgdA/CDA1 family)